MKIGQTLSKLLKSDNAQVYQCRILVVSDDHVTLTGMFEIIQNHGHTVQYGTNLEEGIQLITSIDRPDIIILDFVEPEADARGLLQKARIRFGKSNMPLVLFLRDTPEDEAVANDLFADDVLLKPVDAAQLLECVSKLLTKSSGAQE